MAKVDVLDILRSKYATPQSVDFDNLTIPPMQYFLTPQDVNQLHKIATSIRLASKIREKYRMIDEIMKPRGFKRFSAGTNRIVYSFLEDDRFVVKIAVDKVGMQDNPMEYQNQFLLKPYVTKMFYISPCGTVGFAERVLPIKNKAEFKEIANDVFDMLTAKILGKYVVEDIGTKYFMNYGVRRDGYFGTGGPVLLDYPYVYKLDGSKLYCTNIDPVTGIMCNGEIDYDIGFNHLRCCRCGKIYLASNLRDDKVDNNIIIKGGNKMKVVVVEGDNVIETSIPTDEVMKKPSRPNYGTKGLVVAVDEGGKLEVVSAEAPPLRDAAGRFLPKSGGHKAPKSSKKAPAKKKEPVVEEPVVEPTSKEVEEEIETETITVEIENFEAKTMTATEAAVEELSEKVEEISKFINEKAEEESKSKKVTTKISTSKPKVGSTFIPNNNNH